MISSSELRIGNYVLVDQSVHCISMIDRTSSATTAILTDEKGVEIETNTQQVLDSLQPIVLNDTILRQCQFAYHHYFKFWQLVNGQEENRSEMDIDSDYNVIDFMRKPIVKKVTSLHQLQNIYFMLKGKELAYQQESVSV